MHVLFATPTAGGIVKAGYAHTLFKAAIAVRNAGWRADIVTVDGSDVVVARNFFANLLLHRPELTHLMMIDSDMNFDGNVVCRLLGSDKPVVGAAYAKRRMDLRALVQAARKSELAPAELTAMVLDYNLQLELGPVQIIDGMCRVQRLALRVGDALWVGRPRESYLPHQHDGHAHSKCAGRPAFQPVSDPA